ncbi:MAG: ABC transporter ATP-binding protein [Candidatus Saccharibacteria bacterium]
MSKSKPAVEIKGLSKAYMIGHEQEAMAGTMTFRDSLTNTLKKPLELITGHQLKKEKFWALKDVNLEIEQGDVVGIIGRNGSGKSTLLKVLSRIVEPTKGEVIMRGRVASLLEVGTGFHPELTGRENVYFNGAILGMSRKEIQSKFDEIVAFSEVEKFLDTPVKFYSSGMYVRLAFAVAAHLDPDILIVDEVLAVGDAAFQKKCLGKMKDVAGQGRTVLFVSHNLPSVKQLCNKGILLKGGSIIASGTIDTIAKQYLETTSDGEIQQAWVNQSDNDNEYVTISKMSLIKSNNTVATSIVQSTENIYLELEIDVAQYRPDITIGYALSNSSGEILYWSYFSDTKIHPTLKKGVQKIISKIPLEYLSTDEYFIEGIGGIHNKLWLYAPGQSKAKIKFNLSREDADVSDLNTQTRPTILAPSIKWRIK